MQRTSIFEVTNYSYDLGGDYSFTGGQLQGGNARVELSAPALIGNSVISAIFAISQVIVTLIARGLEGNFSAGTLMWVQASTEMWKRLHTMLLLSQSVTG